MSTDQFIEWGIEPRHLTAILHPEKPMIHLPGVDVWHGLTRSGRPPAGMELQLIASSGDRSMKMPGRPILSPWKIGADWPQETGAGQFRDCLGARHRLDFLGHADPALRAIL